MILSALLLAAQAAVPAPVITPEDEVVVIGRRLRDWRGRMKPVAGGGLACTTTRSTGDAEIDAVGCEVLQTCFAGNEATMDAAVAKGVRRRERRERLAAVSKTMGACMTERYPVAIEALADRRAAARMGS